MHKCTRSVLARPSTFVRSCIRAFVHYSIHLRPHRRRSVHSTRQQHDDEAQRPTVRATGRAAPAPRSGAAPAAAAARRARPRPLADNGRRSTARGGEAPVRSAWDRRIRDRRRRHTAIDRLLRAASCRGARPHESRYRPGCPAAMVAASRPLDASACRSFSGRGSAARRRDRRVDGRVGDRRERPSRASIVTGIGVARLHANRAP